MIASFGQVTDSPALKLQGYQPVRCVGSIKQGGAILKFRVEQIFLTDEEGKVTPVGQNRVFHLLEANNVDDALYAFVEKDGAEIVGEVMKLPGFQAIATARRKNWVYTLQLLPVSDRHAQKE